MRRYLKIGVFTIAILAIGYLLGSGAIGNLLRYGEASTSAMADEAETQAELRRLENEFATQERPPSECIDMTVGADFRNLCDEDGNLIEDQEE